MPEPTSHTRTGAREADRTLAAAILEAAGDPVIAVDSDHNIILFNRAAQRAFGYSASEVTGEPLDTLLSSSSPREGEDLTVRRKDGTAFPAEATVARVSDGDRTVTALILRDVTEQRRLERELRENREVYRSTLESMMEGYQIIDRDWCYRFVNGAAAAHGRRAREQLVGRTMMECYPDIEQTYMFRVLRRCMEERVADRMVNEFVYPDGQRGWFELRIEPVPEGILILSIDITERKRAEESLRLDSEMMKNLAEGVSLIRAGDGVIVHVNPRFQKMFGYDANEIIGKHVSVLNARGDRSPRETAADIIAALKQSGEWSGQVRNVRKDGTAFWCDLRVSTFEHSAYGTVWVSVHQDVTERHAAAERAEIQLRRLAALREIDTAITGSIDLKLVLNVILEQTTTHLRADAASVLLLNRHDQILRFAAGRGFRGRAVEQGRLRIDEGTAGAAVRERRVVHLHDPARSTEFTRAPLLSEEGFVEYHAAPLVARGHVVGVLEVFHRTPFEASEEWLFFLETLAGQTAIAIDSAQLFEHLQRSNQDLTLAYDQTIEGWSRALDLRDRETEGHTQRVTEMTERLARAMGIAEEQLVHIRRGALLHDIGKMGVPDSILLKPGPLTDEEWVVMRRHPQLAFDMLSPIAFLRPALDIPGCHHEKWDGTGYPRRLKGEQIPLAARLFAVVDVWDALRSDRPYRCAWPEDKVLEFLRSQSGTHFEPRVVDLFLRMLAER